MKKAQDDAIPDFLAGSAYATAHMEAKAPMSSAAALIQAQYRGKSTRRQLMVAQLDEDKNKMAAARKLQAMQRGKSARREMAVQREGAIRIQAVARRRKAKKKRGELEATMSVMRGLGGGGY